MFAPRPGGQRMGVDGEARRRSRAVVRYITRKQYSERSRCRVVNRHVSVGIKKVLRVDFPGRGPQLYYLKFKILFAFYVNFQTHNLYKLFSF